MVELTRDQLEVALDFMMDNGFTGGLEVLVNTSDYGPAAERWCPVERHLFRGSAGVYPVKVDGARHDLGQMQFKRSELLGGRMIEPLHPDWPAELPGERLANPTGVTAASPLA